METIRKIVIFCIGTALLFPCLIMFSDSVKGLIFGGLYSVIMYNLPKYSQSIKKFWREYMKIFEISKEVK